MSRYYHLRVDCPNDSFVVENLEDHNPSLTNYYWTTEVAKDTGKYHVHMIIWLEEEQVQPLRLFMQGTYKKRLKKEEYWSKTYGDSKKIQVYSLQQVRDHNKIWAYIHKDYITQTAQVDWNSEHYTADAQKKVDEEKEKEEQLFRDIDEFWEEYNKFNEIHYGVNGTVLYGCYMHALERFYQKFGPIKSFKVVFLKSAYKHGIIEFNTYMDKLYRL